MTKSKKTTLYIVDDHRIVIQGIRGVLSDHDDFQIIGHSTDGLDAVNQIRSLKPDIVIMDISMPNFNGIEVTHEIRKSRSSTKIIIYSMSSEKEHVLSAFKSGISGYVLKEEALEDLLMALKTVRGGGTYYSRTIEKHIRTHLKELELGAVHGTEIGNDISRLSHREMEIFPLLADGKSIRDISKILCISPKTVESHKYNIMEKLGVSSIAALTKLAIKKDLIKIE